MSRIAALFRWLGTPFRAARSLFPFTSDGRQTLVFLMFALSVPVLTVMARLVLLDTKGVYWTAYTAMADKIAWALIIGVSAQATYVAWRTIKFTKDGFEASAKEAPQAAQKVADAAQQTADEIKGDADGTDQR